MATFDVIELGKKLAGKRAGGSGFGLGLAICHEITQALGGSIQLHNRRQNGRIVGLDAIVTLPLS